MLFRCLNAVVVLPLYKISFVERKKNHIIENVVVEDIGGEGKALARVNGKIVFIPKAVPGDVVDVRVKKDFERYAEGQPVRIRKHSNLRVEPKCVHFGVCGGCHWQHLPYQKQLYYKHKQVIYTFVRLGKLKGFESCYILPSKHAYRYRNKLEFTFSKQRWLDKNELNVDKTLVDSRGLGFYLPRKYFKILDIHTCHLQPEPSNTIRLALKKFAFDNNLDLFEQRENKGFIRSIIIRNSSKNNWMIVVTFHHESPLIKDVLDFLQNEFPQITSVHYVINPHFSDVITHLGATHYSGDACLLEEMEGLRFRIGPKSFYQPNTAQAHLLYKVAREFATLNGNETVYDLYTGTGTIANFLARHCRKVVGIEYVEEAIADARINSNDNGIENAVFYAGDMKDILGESLFQKEGRPDVIITDPPRAGMHSDVIGAILNAEPQKIVYVSCNPSTQVRDIKQLTEKYELLKIQPVDMFPQTYHVENVALLKKR